MTPAGGPERRTHPRFAAHLRARARDVDMFTANVSRSGMQLACAVTLATIIQRDLDSGRLTLELELPGDGPCRLTAAVRYATEVDDEVLVGLEISGFESGTAEARYHAFCEEAATRYRVV